MYYFPLREPCCCLHTNDMARRKLSKDEQDLWKKVKESAVPLSRPKATPIAPQLLKKKDNVQDTRPLKAFQIRPASKPSTITLPPPHGKPDLKMDQKAFVRMTRGRLEPEATLDLHGYTLAQAHPLLLQFIQRNYHANRRLVLVITGKGGKQKHLSDEAEGYGVLRKQAPLWLASPPFKSKILQVHEAHLKHGGSGALYVYLTRNRAKT